MSDTCAWCKGPLEAETPESIAEADAEREAVWGVPQSACEVVCEDCWQAFMANDPALKKAVETKTRHEDFA